LIFNVNIYPVLEAPCAADVLAGRPLVKVIEQHVLDDPEVSSLLKRLGNDGILAELLLQRFPLSNSDGKILDFFATAAVHRKTRQRQIRCARVIQRRLSFLGELLRSGKLVVVGASANTSAEAALPPDFWDRSYVYIDCTLGYLYFRSTIENEPLLLLRGARVEMAQPHSVVPNVKIPSTGKAERKDEATSAAINACEEWLTAEMRASPDKKPKPKAAYLKEAMERWGKNLSEEGFERSWANARKKVGANWGKAGRSRKSGT
jgi:hypothetical protein